MATKTRTIAYVTIILLTSSFCFAEKPSIIDGVSCVDYFCGKLQSQEMRLQCSALMHDSDDCKCALLPETKEKYCDSFTKEHLHISVDSGTTHSYVNGINLSVVMQGTIPVHFDILINTFFKYVSFMNISHFKLAAYCRHGLPASNCYSYFPSKMSKGATLNLLGNYKKSTVQVLDLSNNCICKIQDSFSSVFPDLKELNLSRNHLTVVPVEAFAHLHRLEKLDLSCNQLLFIGEEFFFIGLYSLIYLDLSVNCINVLHSHVFYDLVNLQTMNISRNMVYFLPEDIFIRNLELKVLDLSYCFLEFNPFTVSFPSPKWLFHGLNKLQKLSLESNRLSILPSETFLSNYGLKFLNLKRNMFSNFWLIANQFVNPVDVDLTNNCLSQSNPSAAMQNQLADRIVIKKLICHFCCLNTTMAANVLTWVNSTADLRQNPIYEIDTNFLQNAAHLQKLHISGFPLFTNSSSNSSVTDIHNLVHNLENIKHLPNDPQAFPKIDLMYPLYIFPNSQNPNTRIIMSDYSFFDCDYLTLMKVNMNVTKSPTRQMIRSNMKFFLKNITLHYVKYRTTTDIYSLAPLSQKVCNFTFYCPAQCTCYSIGPDEVITINCVGKYLTVVPNIVDFSTPVILYLSHNQIQSTGSVTAHGWSIIKELYLNYNYVDSLESFVLSPVLQILDLRNNRLKHFSTLGKSMHPNGNKVQLMISGNQWQCDCDTFAIKNHWLITDTDISNATCTSLNSRHTIYLANATYIDLCPSRSKFFVFFPIVVFVIVSSAVICYCNKARLKVCLSHNHCPPVVSGDDIDKNKLYDAFVSYSTKDEEWVGYRLVAGLEREPPFYKLCLHNRDWPAGEWITNQIFLSVKLSRRTIIVLTDNFVNSDWSRMEFMAAYQQALSDKVNRVIVVVPGEIPEAAKLGKELATFVRLNTYVKCNDPHFWKKLRAAMPQSKDKIKGTPEENDSHF